MVLYFFFVIWRCWGKSLFFFNLFIHSFVFSLYAAWTINNLILSHIFLSVPYHMWHTINVDTFSNLLQNLFVQMYQLIRYLFSFYCELYSIAGSYNCIVLILFSATSNDNFLTIFQAFVTYLLKSLLDFACCLIPRLLHVLGNNHFLLIISALFIDRYN